MKAVVFDRIGSPLEVLSIRDVPVPPIGEHDVLVELEAASINPGDLLFVQGLYPAPKTPKVPQQIAGTGGGVGRVVKGGPGTSLTPGTRVAFSYYDAWAEYAVVPERWLIPLPAHYPVETAAQIANVISAWDLLHESRVEPGQWLALTAGSSAVGTMVLQLARAKGVKVVCIVRRAQPDLDLVAWGADAVIELSDLPTSIGGRIAEITEAHGLDGVIDCVGGPLGGDLVRALAMGGRLVVYGGFSPEPMTVHSFDLLMKVASMTSYAYRYFFDPPPPEDRPLLHEIIALSGAPSFRTRVAARHALDDFRVAIEASVHHAERGKHLFRMGPSQP